MASGACCDRNIGAVCGQHHVMRAVGDEDRKAQFVDPVQHTRPGRDRLDLAHEAECRGLRPEIGLRPDAGERCAAMGHGAVGLGIEEEEEILVVILALGHDLRHARMLLRTVGHGPGLEPATISRRTRCGKSSANCWAERHLRATSRARRPGRGRTAKRRRRQWPPCRQSFPATWPSERADAGAVKADDAAVCGNDGDEGRIQSSIVPRKRCSRRSGMPLQDRRCDRPGGHWRFRAIEWGEC